MLYKTHLAAGLVLGIVFLRYTHYFDLTVATGMLFFLALTIASLLPDIDTPASYIGREIPAFAWLARLVAGHRGLFHAIWIPVLLLIALIRAEPVGFGAFVGYCSHLIADSLTVEGIRPLYPGRARLRGFVQTGGFAEGVCFVALALLGAFLAMQTFHFWGA